MKISASAAYAYCRSGRYGGQIPTLTISLGPASPDSDIVDLPDAWFIRKLSNGLPTTSENSYMYWSRRGLRENRAELERQFKTAPGFRAGEPHDYGLTFDQWLALCEADNARIDTAVDKAQKAARKKLAQLAGYVNS